MGMNGNGAREDETLEEAVARTVASQYDGIDPIDFGNRMWEERYNDED